MIARIAALFGERPLAATEEGSESQAMLLKKIVVIVANWLCGSIHFLHPLTPPTPVHCLVVGFSDTDAYISTTLFTYQCLPSSSIA